MSFIFVGGSTVALALGNAENDHPRKIVAFDQFIYHLANCSDMLQMHPQIVVDSGTTQEDVFGHQTDFQQRAIELVQSDIANVSWNGSDISVLFVDAAKSWCLNDKG